MRQIDREYSIRREVTAATKREDAIEMIRMALENDIPKDRIVISVKRLGIKEDDIESLYQQVMEEQKVVIS